MFINELQKKPVWYDRRFTGEEPDYRRGSGGRALRQLRNCRRRGLTGLVGLFGPMTYIRCRWDIIKDSLDLCRSRWDVINDSVLTKK